jgi:hypothetical protein
MPETYPERIPANPTYAPGRTRLADGLFVVLDRIGYIPDEEHETISFLCGDCGFADLDIIIVGTRTKDTVGVAFIAARCPECLHSTDRITAWRTES